MNEVVNGAFRAAGGFAAHGAAKRAAEPLSARAGAERRPIDGSASRAGERRTAQELCKKEAARGIGAQTEEGFGGGQFLAGCTALGAQAENRQGGCRRGPCAPKEAEALRQKGALLPAKVRTAAA